MAIDKLNNDLNLNNFDCKEFIKGIKSNVIDLTLREFIKYITTPPDFP